MVLHLHDAGTCGQANWRTTLVFLVALAGDAAAGQSARDHRRGGKNKQINWTEKNTSASTVIVASGWDKRIIGRVLER